MEGGRTPSHLRDLNSRAIVRILQREGPTARVHLARTLGLSKATVTLTVRDLLEDGLVDELGEDAAQPRLSGRQPQLVAINARAASLLAIDIGAVRTTAVLASLDGTVLLERVCLTPRTHPDVLLEQLLTLVQELVRDAGPAGGPLGAVVVGVPGMVDAGQAIDDAVNVPALSRLPLRERLSAWCGAPVRLENDINLAAIGEHTAGAAGAFRTFAFVSLGTGIGAGLYLDGKMYRGAHGFAGEVGEMVLREQGDQALGLETLVAGEALSRQAHARGLDTDGDGVQALFASARAGDALALVVLRDSARALAHGLFNIHLLLDLEAIFLGGGVGGNFDLWAPVVDELLRAHHSRPPLLLPSALGVRASLAGALSLAQEDCWEHLYQRLSARRKLTA